MTRKTIPTTPLSTNTNKDQERYLPIANVSRIMKKSLPANAKISKEAKETVQECVSEFISFVTGEASDKCHKEKRKTVNGDDLLWAMTTLGFENYVGRLKDYLNKYKEIEGDKNCMARQEDNASCLPLVNDVVIDDDQKNVGKFNDYLERFNKYHHGKEGVIGYGENILSNEIGHGVEW